MKNEYYQSKVRQYMPKPTKWKETNPVVDLQSELPRRKEGDLGILDLSRPTSNKDGIL
jgi:hypothetical protein